MLFYKNSKIEILAVQRGKKDSACALRIVSYIVLFLYMSINVSLAQLKSVDQKHYTESKTSKRIGAFSVEADLASGVYYDSNIFEATTNATSDVVYYIVPRVIIQSHVPRHSLSLDMGLKRLDYKDSDVDSSTEYDAILKSKIGIRKDLSLDISVTGAHLSQKRTFGDATVPTNLAKPLDKDYFKTNAALTKKFNRLNAVVAFSYEKTDIDDAIDTLGNSVEQDFNDKEVYKVGAKFEYYWSSKMQLLFGLGAEFEDFRKVGGSFLTSSGLNLSNRDVDRVYISKGIYYNFSSITQAQFNFALTQEEYDNPSIPDLGVLPSFEALIYWVPNSIWSTKFKVGWEDAGVDFSEDAASSEVTRLAAIVTYHPRKYFTIQSTAAYEYSDFEVSEEDLYLYNLSTSYAITKGVLFSVDYGFEKEVSSNDSTLKRHIVQGSFKSKF
ncbi:MAG: outer membrane beta-barrel protein [Pseudomonadota bacterium]